MRPLAKSIFEPLTINGVTFENRVLRSSMGGRMAYYDGVVTDAWKNFELRFAQNGIKGIISATVGVNKRRMSPMQYPMLHEDRFIPALRDGVKAVRALGCRYIMQIGDPGGHTHSSLFADPEDAKSSSAGFDLVYGYTNRTVAMTQEEIEVSIDEFAQAARRVREIGCDGVEVTASKGYLIHQFLNPGVNRRTDAWGGSTDKRFRFLESIVRAVRQQVGGDFLFGIRLSAKDYNYLPLNLRWPPVRPLRHYFIGNDLGETLDYGRRLEQLGVDYLHIDSGFGFPNPLGNPGTYPEDGVRLFVNSVSHLSGKARLRAMGINLLPRFLARAVMGRGWRARGTPNADFAKAFRQATSIPIIANGGFQSRHDFEGALSGGKCDLVAVARPLLANPDLLKQFARGQDAPDKPCSYCTLCCTKTAVLPLGCYDRRRFGSQQEMQEEILRWSASRPLET
jgi:2,4-dienoyl-CoA reductase (NADPH2)